ncbi:unnamed protein product [Darwinula stevensoni]|uniref:SOUL heme-binding protein n=1 Tax=Darwinula stevensoni TaxID=69355 RepID=A0A7R9AEA3_9CRUS|nr:unnamed protein product [Darwinula stevensoni]CAG0901820.1 unnamed protein product [Darwinula stevensoni]
MTVPVTQHLKTPTAYAESSDMCFYIPQKFQENPPEPAEKEVYIEERKTEQFLVNRFSGFASRRDYEKVAAKLLEAATRDAVKGVDNSTHWIAGYQSPWKLFSRRNEVWFRVEG